MPGSAPTAIAGLAAAAALVALPSCGGGSGETSTATPAKRAPGPRVTLEAPTHRPEVGAPWPIAIRARDAAGRPLRAEVRYRFLLGGQVVARRSHYRFRGVFRDTLRWPARSLGVPLTFRAVVETPLGTRRLDYDVRVKR
jgi:hypothetical protein